MTTHEDDSRGITLVHVGLSIFSFGLMIFISGGNILTLVAIARTTVLRTLANIYVSSLAVADLIVGLGCCLTGLFMLPPLKYKYFDNNLTLCIFMQGTLIGSVLVSSFHMTLISFDRYIYITRPYLYPRLFTKRNILIIITCIWVFGVVAIIIPHFDHNGFSGVRDCDLSVTLPRWYLFYLTSCTYTFNLAIACVFYSRILLAALKQRKSIQATAVIPAVVNGEDQKQKKNVPGGESARIGLKSIKFFFTIFGFYFVCVTPCFVAVAVDLYADADENAVRATTLLAMMNSGMNFVIYVVLNRQFKTAFVDILRCRQSSQ